MGIRLISEWRYKNLTIAKHISLGGLILGSFWIKKGLKVEGLFSSFLAHWGGLFDILVEGQTL